MMTPTDAPRGANATAVSANGGHPSPLTSSGRNIAHLDIPTLRSCAAIYRREADHLFGLGAKETASNLIQAAEEHEARAAHLEAAGSPMDDPPSPINSPSASIAQPTIPNATTDQPDGMTSGLPTPEATTQKPDLASPPSGSIDRPAESADQHLTESTMLMMTDAPRGANAPTMSIPSSFGIPPVGTPSGPSSVIPAVGVTFTEAEARAMVCPTSLGLIGDAADQHATYAADLSIAVHETPPTTLQDAIVKLRMATSELGYGGGECPMAGESVDQVREWLERNGAAALASKGVASPLSVARGVDTINTPLFPVPWIDKSAKPINHTVELAVVGPFYLDIIDYLKPGPVSGRQFGWFVYGLMRSGMLADGEEDSKEAAKAAAEEALRTLIADRPELLHLEKPGWTRSTSHAVILDGLRSGYDRVLDILSENDNYERYEANMAVVASWLCEALAGAGPFRSTEEARNFAGFQAGLWECLSSVTNELAGGTGAIIKAIGNRLSQFIDHETQGATLIGAHPDAALLAAWDGYVAATRAYDLANEALPDGGNEEESIAPFSRTLFAIGDKIETTPAHTMAGIAVQLRYLFAGVVESPDAADSAIFGKPPSEELESQLEDRRWGMLWNMIGTAERMSGSSHRDHLKTGDTFGAGVQAFASEVGCQ